MDGTNFDQYCVILSNLAAANVPKWNAGVMKLYEVGLRDVPNDITGPLSKLTVDRYTFRPSVAQVKAMAREILHGPPLSLTAALVEVNRYLDRLGRWGKEPRGLCVTVPSGTGYKQLQAVLRWSSADVPEWSCPELARTVEAMGGWEDLATTPPKFWLSRFERIYADVLDSAEADGARRLHLAYTAQKQLVAPVALLHDDYEEDAA